MSQTIEAAKPEAAPQARAKWLESDSWPAYLLRRFGTFVISLWALVTAAFLMLQLIPGDPVRLALGMNAPVELVETTRSQLGYDLPLWQQYFRFVGGLLSGNPGDSITLRTPVFEVIASRLPATLELAVLTVVTVLLVGIPIGLIFAALTRNGRRRGVEIGYTATSGTIAVIPEFLISGFKVGKLPWIGGPVENALHSWGMDFIFNGMGINFFFGGTSLLIVIGVAMDTVQQVESQLIMRHYDGFVRKTRIRGRR